MPILEHFFVQKEKATARFWVMQIGRWSWFTSGIDL